MNIKKFDININKKNVFKILDIDKTITEKDILFEEMKRIFYKSVLPICLYELKNKKIGDFKFSIFVLMSLGDTVDNEISNLFEIGEYFKAMILNAICDDFLLQMDNIVVSEISDFICNKKLGFGKRFYPHENIEASKMKEISQNLESFKWGITVNDSFVINPLKSIGFIIGADFDADNNISHNCEKCCKKECRWRNLDA